MATKKNYVNGAFANRVKNFDLINIDFTEEFLSNLKALPKNAKGMRRISIGATKSDPSKWSIFENDFVPTKGGGGATDDLPF